MYYWPKESLQSSYCEAEKGAQRGAGGDHLRATKTVFRNDRERRSSRAQCFFVQVFLRCPTSSFLLRRVWFCIAGANCRCQNFFKKEGTTGIKASFRVVLETSPLWRCVQVLVCSERHAKATQDQGKELPALEICQGFGEQSMKACLQWAPSNPLPFCIFYGAVILGTVEFFNNNPVMHLCS